ncbi:MAG: hypothetical protein Nk1A_9220 [Endomicrobiia bacterium]|nr:MAG: hypothetical protein Nk1A_9220 [Endomicrobiia bacterium]
MGAVGHECLIAPVFLYGLAHKKKLPEIANGENNGISLLFFTGIDAANVSIFI